MMRNFKLTLEYDGYEFSGWQFQPYQRTVQGHLQEKLERIFKKKINCIASGRTDTGVHALGQVVHFKADTIMKPKQIQKALNAFLDRDVSVVKIQDAPLDFHAQYSVKNKTYRYTILNRNYPSAFWRNRAYFYPHNLNLPLMRKAAAKIKGRHDFKCFQAASERSKIKDTVRTISQLTITQEGDFVYITVTSNGFLYRMVRNIVGTLLAVGSKKLPVSAISDLIKAKNRKLSPPTAPSHGLCLMTVRY
jgi:tRNA pseudouridine38-40 synthase